MKDRYKRIIATCLLFTLTVALVLHCDTISKRIEIANATGINSITDRFLKEHFSEDNQNIQELIDNSGKSGDKAFLKTIASTFGELFLIAKDLAKENISVTSPEFTGRVKGIFEGLFKIDIATMGTNPNINGLNNTGFTSLAAKKIWTIMDYYDKDRLSSQKVSDGIEIKKGIPYINDGTNEHMLDIYNKADGAKKKPVIIDIHGGGLMYGDKEMNRIYVSRLAEKGFVVVNVNYRICPNVLYPSQVADIMSSYKWVAENADEYGFDLNNVFVVGDSAGGQLAFYTSIVNTSEYLKNLYEVENTGLNIKALGLISGMFDMKSGLNSVLNPCILGYEFKTSKYFPYLQPEEIIDLGTPPPAYIVTSAKDFLRSASQDLDRLLSEKGVEHRFHDWEITINRSSGHITSVAYPDFPESVTTTNELVEFLQRYITN
ncbi:MAG: alpha/beta hydrolase [Oscillospiraceae bacterium]